MPRWVLAALLVRSVQGVHCGGHTAVDCASCPQGHGADWCNGECAWSEEACVHKSEVKLYESFALPPDTRPKQCQEVTDDLSDLRVSVIIPWLGEVWEHMRDTLLSLLHFTPDELVEEFIFISDGNPDSREEELKAISSKVVVLALKEREGLIRAKMHGVELAKAPVLVFLEAHCIVNRHWLEPLLQRIKQNPKVLVMPALDQIPQGRWRSYSKMAPGHWRFEWNLNLVYTNPGGVIGNDGHEPFASPGTSGGILAMRKDWFEELEFFDPGMLEWGGDHVELTFKTWRCGGRIEIVPCSRVGHLFRDPSHRPYEVEVMQVVANYARLARVWLKDHLHLFNKMKPESVNMKFDELDVMMEKHDRLACKNMSWYLENVDHEMAWEMDKLCHPHARRDDPVKCQGHTALGRSTVNETNLISRPEYKARVRAAADRQEL